MYKVLKTDGRAKRAEFTTVHGIVQTPVFMNVGTVAAIKGAVATTDLQQIGTQIELSNTYHLHVRPGVKHIDPDMDAALVDLKAAIDNEVWREWCDAVMACQADRSLTSILTPIVSKLSDMRVVNAELENLVFGPRKEFITMAILVLINIPLVRFINKDWYHTLVATIPGQMVIAVCLAAVFVSFAFVVKLTQPIEYRR